MANNSSSTALHTQPQPTYKSVQYKEVSAGLEDDGSGSTDLASSYRSVVYRVYPWRWFMLVAMCILNVSNGMVSVCLGLQSMPSEGLAEVILALLGVDVADLCTYPELYSQLLQCPSEQCGLVLHVLLCRLLGCWLLQYLCPEPLGTESVCEWTGLTGAGLGDVGLIFRCMLVLFSMWLEA